jgi:tRNA/tmRNA/rRNA uracil-C5-methylase (TrmA/RlmC/RlmD family)
MENMEIRIDSLAYGGNGVGRIEGIVYFVPYSCPGDLLEIKITKDEKRYKEAEIVSIIEPSPDRVKPPCPYFGTCGGCQWQHVSYPVQLEAKVKELKTALKKSGQKNAINVVQPIEASPLEYGYRRTARFKVQKNTDTGLMETGFYREGSRELVEIDRCLLLDEKINVALGTLDISSREITGFDLFLDEEGRVEPLYRLSEKDAGADFYQVNTGVNRILSEYIKNQVKTRCSGDLRIIDLYSGDGNLSLQFAETASSIMCWDSSKTAVARGRAGAEALRELHPKCRVKFFESDVEKSWKHIAGCANETGCLILDPPRRGLKNQAARLAGLKVPLVFYVSCAPPALARDLAAFRDAGYTIDEIQPLDMFPQTYHLETVTVLSL